MLRVFSLFNYAGLLTCLSRCIGLCPVSLLLVSLRYLKKTWFTCPSLVIVWLTVTFTEIEAGVCCSNYALLFIL